MRNVRNVFIARSGSRGGQRGMTLLVGLILLLMLSVLSTIGFRNTTLSERMTGNSLDRNVSFQSAENAGKEALQVIESNLFNVATPGHYAPPGLAQGGTSSFWTKGDGAAVASVADCLTATPFRWKTTPVSCSVSVAPYKFNSTNAQTTDVAAQYVIELLSQVSSGGSTLRTYRVTSRSVGGSGQADVVLQTIYQRSTTP